MISREKSMKTYSRVDNERLYSRKEVTVDREQREGLHIP